MLDFHVRHFDTVEINNSFYKLPSAQTFVSWRDATPRGFCFAVKASRFLTHRKKLNEPENAINNFLPRVEELKKKLGPILFQLPPRWHANPERLQGLLKILPRRHHYAFEFRDPSWMSQPIYDILRRYNAAFCIYELAGYHSPLEITADWSYIRLHGPGGRYQGRYSRQQLAAWAERIGDWGTRLKGVYVYFDNDQAGFAAKNALELRELVQSPGSLQPEAA
jgi:uncharacterized protein YecE (DUF72 family)